jgi:hypothetical protein
MPRRLACIRLGSGWPPGALDLDPRKVNAHGQNSGWERPHIPMERRISVGLQGAVAPCARCAAHPAAHWPPRILDFTCMPSLTTVRRHGSCSFAPVEAYGRSPDFADAQAAEKATTESIAFMIKHTSGVICCSLPVRRRCPHHLIIPAPSRSPGFRPSACTGRRTPHKSPTSLRFIPLAAMACEPSCLAAATLCRSGKEKHIGRFAQATV